MNGLPSGWQRGDIMRRLGKLVVRAELIAAIVFAIWPNGLLAADRATRPIKSLRRLDDTIHRFGGYGDNWHMSWAENGKVYVSLCDGRFLPGAEGPKVASEYNSRMYAITGDAPELKF